MPVKSRKAQSLTTQAEAVVHFFAKLDIGMIDLLLDGSRTYQDMTKKVFISKLACAFERFMQSGDTALSVYRGGCRGNICGRNLRGYSFIGDHSGNYMDLIIRVKKGFIQDIHECHLFEAKQGAPKRNEKIRVDDPEDVF